MRVALRLLVFAALAVIPTSLFGTGPAPSPTLPPPSPNVAGIGKSLFGTGPAPSPTLPPPSPGLAQA